MKLKLFMTIFLVTSIFFNIKAEENPLLSTISGDITACTDEVYTYSVVNDPAVYYEWTITNGTFVSSPVGSNLVDVVWYDDPGTITVSTYSDPGLTILISSTSLNVSVDVLDPYITMDPEVGCLDERGHQESFNPQEEEDECHKACEENPISYFSNGNAGSTFTWQVIGDANIILNTSSELRVEWLSVGFGVVKLKETSVNGCMAETEICVEVIPKPEALFDVIPGLTVCIGQTVFFEDLSQAIGDADLTAWEWSVSDGTFQAYTESTDFSHIFNTSGIYEVNLRVYNTCGCYDDYTVEIEVIGDPGPDIQCPKVVCANEKTVLTTSSTCGTYFWSVDNGMIVSGLGTSSITVMWDDDPGGVGYVYLSTPCGACNIPTVLEIPIVSTSLDIEGPIEVCVGDQVTLTAPQIPGTFYNWNVYSSPTSAFIVEEIHNQVIIDVVGNFPITVEVVYNNELAGCGDGCGGTATHTMIAVAPSFISGPTEVCVGDSESYSIFGPAVGNIKVETPNGSTSFISNGGNFNFTLDGIHIFTPANAGCQGPPLLVNAHAIPPPPDFINGPIDVCPGIPYVYEAGNDVNGTIYSWSVTNGTPATGVGKEIAVTWNAVGPYLLEAQRINIQTPYCESTFIPLSVNPISIAPAYDISATAVCANQSYTYSLDYEDGEEYNWTITAEGQGSVITDPNSHTVDILWNNTSGSAVIIASVRKCNIWYDVPLNVVINPVSNVSFTASDNLICQNQSVTFVATPGYSIYDWSIDPMFGGSIPNSSGFTRTFTDAGTFNVTLVATDMCGNLSIHSEVITVLPEPPAQLSISVSTLECLGGVVVSGSATLVTTIIGGTAGHTFAWKRNSVSFGGSTPIVTVTDVGLYEVTVTNTATGCTTVETLNIQCPPAPPCTMPASNTGTFNFIYDNTTCGEVTFNQTSVTFAPGWTFAGSTYSHIGVNSFSAPGPTYTYSSFNDAGYYIVTNELCYSHPSLGGCCTSVSQNVPIPVVAEAEANAFCDMSGTYMIQLDDFSSSLGDLAGYNVTWLINGGVVSTMTGVSSGTTSVPLGGLTPGSTYPVVLQVFVPMGAVAGMPSAYQCEYSTNVVIPALPDATFTHNAPVCEDLDVEFIAAVNGPNSTYHWSFGDGASLIQTVNTAARKYDGPMGGGYNVVLTVTNAAGCIDTDNANVNVVTNDFDNPVIDVSPITPICKPNPATLTFMHSGTATATSFDWSDGATVNPNVVFDAGGYIVTATDAFGCVAVTGLTPVDIRPAPTAVIFGEGSYCFSDDLPVQLFGYAGPGLTYQWRKKPSGGTWSIISTADNISDSFVFPSGSPYEYELTVTDPATGCSAVTIKTIEVHSAPPIPTVIPMVTNCSPYTVNLQAMTTISPAYFNWSNGDTGASIDVLHGGLYEVTLTDDNGCSSARQVDIEGEPNLDFFPVGCYVYCKDDMPLLYPGPYGNFDFWRLLRDGIVVQSGTGPITNLAVTDEGTYMLEVTDNGCVFESGKMIVEFDDKKCKEICKEKCTIKVGEIYPEHIQDCLYEFSADIYLGECTNIVDYSWTINNVPVPGGAVMSYVFGAPGVSYLICLTVTGEDDFGNQCQDKVCIKFEPTCKCDCDVFADFDIVQENCEFKFISTSTSSKCTEIYQYLWTFSYNGEIFEYIYDPEFSYGFNIDIPIEVCLTVYGHDGIMECEDIICKTIYPCNGGSSSKSDESDISVTRSGLEHPNILINPNPVLDKLRIQSKGTFGKEWHVVVVDLTGRLVSNNTVTVKQPMLIISTEGWKNGMYYISISDELGNKFVRKFIKVD